MVAAKGIWMRCKVAQAKHEIHSAKRGSSTMETSQQGCRMLYAYVQGRFDVREKQRVGKEMLECRSAKVREC